MNSSIHTSAEYLSANCFLNSYLREFSDWEFVKSGFRNHFQHSDDFLQGAIRILHGSDAVWLKVVHFSDCGRHRFGMPAVLEDKDGRRKEVNYLDLAAWLVNKSVAMLSIEQAQESVTAKNRFLQRIKESHDNVGRVLISRKGELEKLYQSPIDFCGTEQALLIGHSVHPAPKVRQPMSFEEAMTYGPDGGSGFQLKWLMVRRDRLHYRSADDVTLTERIEQIVQSDTTLLDQGWSASEEYELIPAHPWQWQILRTSSSLQKALASRDIVELEEDGQPWFATSSMRSLYADNTPYMLKFSMSVRLTNSIRHLQPVEAERGNLICHVLDSQPGKEFQQNFPQFTVMREPAYVCLMDDDGELLPETMMVFRDNPMEKSLPYSVELLATLTQDHPDGGLCRLSRIIQQFAQENRIDESQSAIRWFDAYLDMVVKPLILAQADYGMLMGAHQQNLVLGLDKGLPVHCYFRDCQGTGFSDVGVKQFALSNEVLGDAAGNHVQQEMGNTLFAYYLIINSTFSVISALGADGIIDEALLLGQLKEFLIALYSDERKDNSFLDYLLNSEELWQKGNFICSLSDLNENTLENPLSIYQPILNPIVALNGEHDSISMIEQSRPF